MNRERLDVDAAPRAPAQRPPGAMGAVRQGAVNKQKLVYKMKFPYYCYYSFSARGEEFATTRGSRDPASFCLFVKDFESKFGSVMRFWEEF